MSDPTSPDTTTRNCGICGRTTSELSSNPGGWPVHLGFVGGNGATRIYCQACVMRAVAKQGSEGTSAPPPSAPLISQPERAAHREIAWLLTALRESQVELSRCRSLLEEKEAERDAAREMLLDATSMLRDRLTHDAMDRERLDVILTRQNAWLPTLDEIRGIWAASSQTEGQTP